MSEILTETLLEMHFHHALVKDFKVKYGVNFLKLLKPSQRKEAWVGFDQGWANTTLTTNDLFSELKTAIHSNANRVQRLYLGFFYQFKKVDKLVRKSRYMPEAYDAPYYRSELSLSPNDSTGLSQHETLIRLSNVRGATVNYACPMLFDPSEIWGEPDLNKLRLVDITTSTISLTSDERHFITFQTEDDPSPLWCSDPIKGTSYGYPKAPKMELMDGEAIYEQIIAAYSAIKYDKHEIATEDQLIKNEDIFEIIPPSLTIVEFERK